MLFCDYGIKNLSRFFNEYFWSLLFMMQVLAKKLKKLLEKNKKEVLDILLFGSFVKGRLSPEDIDIAVLDLGVERSLLKKEILTFLAHADIQFVRFEDYTKGLWLTLLREGYSVKYGKYLHELYQVQPSVLYSYSLQGLNASQKVMFVPLSLSSEFADFLKHWNLDIDAKEYGLMPLLRKEEL